MTQSTGQFYTGQPSRLLSSREFVRSTAGAPHSQNQSTTLTSKGRASPAFPRRTSRTQPTKYPTPAGPPAIILAYLAAPMLQINDPNPFQITLLERDSRVLLQIQQHLTPTNQAITHNQYARNTIKLELSGAINNEILTWNP